jgi:hypothetical protein
MRTKIMRKKIFIFNLLLPLAWLLPGDARAMTYWFKQTGGGTFLAILTLNESSPFDYTAAERLEFTAEGDAIFGFGVGQYNGLYPFDSRTGPLVVEEDGGLRGLGTTNPSSFWDYDPPASTNLQQPEEFIIRFREMLGGDEIEYSIPGGSGARVGSYGDWVNPQVPLPATLPLLGSAIGLLGFLRYWKRRAKS